MKVSDTTTTLMVVMTNKGKELRFVERPDGSIQVYSDFKDVLLVKGEGNNSVSLYSIKDTRRLV